MPSPVGVVPVVAAVSSTDSISYVTASAGSLPVGQVLLLCVTGVGGTGVAPPTISHTGVTWVLIATIAPSSANSQVFLYRAALAVGQSSSGAITITWNDARTGCGWILLRFTDSNPGNNGADGVDTPVTSTVATTTPNVTLAALAGPESLAVGFLRVGSISAITSGALFVTQVDVNGSAPATRFDAETANNETFVDFTCTNNTPRLIGVEVKALPDPVGTPAAGRMLAVF